MLTKTSRVVWLKQQLQRRMLLTSLKPLYQQITRNTLTNADSFARSLRPIPGLLTTASSRRLHHPVLRPPTPSIFPHRRRHKSQIGHRPRAQGTHKYIEAVRLVSNCSAEIDHSLATREGVLEASERDKASLGRFLACDVTTPGYLSRNQERPRVLLLFRFLRLSCLFPSLFV
jgi:hypothetical protein